MEGWAVHRLPDADDADGGGDGDARIYGMILTRPGPDGTALFEECVVW